MELKEKIKLLPRKPGVYLFKDSTGKIIYIGKTISLRDRVSSYFSSKPSDPKTERLITKIDDLEFILVDNEVEALVLEANLVREYKPRYNINLKDDKRFPLIWITDETFPRIEVVRRRSKDGIFFGPYTDVGSMRATLKIIEENFRLRLCKHNLPDRKPQRPCLNFDIGRCDAPCFEKISREEYAKRIEDVVLFLKGKRKELIERLSERMFASAERKDFELAASLRDQISAIDSIWQKQKIDIDLEDRDLHAIAVGVGDAIAVTMQVREGRLIARQEFHLAVSPGTPKSEIMSGYLSQYYSENQNPPREIFVSVIPETREEIEKLVSERRGAKVVIKFPERGDKHDLIKMVERNAELLLSDLVAEKKKVQLPFGIIELEKELRLRKPPRTIEAIDISHLGGTLAVGSLVTFRDGKKFPRGYRRFKIKSAEPGNDYSSIYEVVKRRIERLKEENAGFPDLLLIDGGKGQLTFAIKAIEEAGLESKIEVASIAKRFEEVYRPGMQNSIMLPKDSVGLRILVKVRNEAHRFAVEYQRKRRTKAFRAKELKSIRGIGEKRQKILLDKFASLEEIANSSEREITERTKIPSDIAGKIIEALSEYRTVLFIFLAIIFSFVGCAPSPRYLGDIRPKTEKTAEKVERETPEKPEIKTEKPKEKPTESAKKDEAKSREKETARVNPREDVMMGTINLYMGSPYKYGGNDAKGFDCSGFVNKVYSEVGIKLPRSSKDLFKIGVSVDNPSFGDLVFFHCRSRTVDHVGIYLWERKFVHASSRVGVTIDTLDDPYYKNRYLGARRVE